MAGQRFERSEGVHLIRVFDGRDESGRRRYIMKPFTGRRKPQTHD